MKPATQKCLDRLREADGQWLSGNRLFEVSGVRYGARIYELRQMGYVVERRSAPNGSPVDWYRLVEREAA